MNSSAILRVTNLEVLFRSGFSIAFPDLEASPSDFLLIDGPSGAGKSTLLATIGGLLRPRRGEVVFDGADVIQWRPWETDRWRARNVGIVPQRLHFCADLTALQNVELANWAGGLRAKLPAATELLRRVGLGERLHYLPRQLSVGQSARLAIARALANSPRMLLLDEPTANLDAETAREILQLLMEMRTELGAAVLISTHDARVFSTLGSQARTYHL